MGGSVKDNIITIFGNKFFNTLTPVDISLPRAASQSEVSKVVGYISKSGLGEFLIIHLLYFNISSLISITKYSMYFPTIGVGRQDSERQFVFINGRPVDIGKITR